MSFRRCHDCQEKNLGPSVFVHRTEKRKQSFRTCTHKHSFRRGCCLIHALRPDALVHLTTYNMVSRFIIHATYLTSTILFQFTMLPVDLGREAFLSQPPGKNSHFFVAQALTRCLYKMVVHRQVSGYFMFALPCLFLDPWPTYMHSSLRTSQSAPRPKLYNPLVFYQRA
jgi:hypothetical protein